MSDEMLAADLVATVRDLQKRVAELERVVQETTVQTLGMSSRHNRKCSNQGCGKWFTFHFPIMNGEVLRCSYCKQPQ